RALAETRNVEAALNALFESLSGAIRCRGVRLIDHEDRLFVAGKNDARKVGAFPIRNDRQSLGHVEVLRDQPLLREEERTVEILVERFGTTLRRMQLTSQLVEAAEAEERLRLADRLHDGFIQTLAAVDMRAEAAKGLIRLTPTQAADELDTIKHLARDAAAEARTFLLPPEPASTINRQTIRALLERRWAGACEVCIDERLRLSDDQWQAVEMLAREGSNNAIRHGYATEVWLDAREHGNEVVVTLQSNGKTPRLPVQYGYGLGRLESVVQGLKGKLSLGRRPEGGSVLTARFPKEEF
ncbi:MAG TPA: histidine kinase, partial [Fimbriimonas sp.]